MVGNVTDGQEPKKESSSGEVRAEKLVNDTATIREDVARIRELLQQILDKMESFSFESSKIEKTVTESAEPIIETTEPDDPLMCCTECGKSLPMDDFSPCMTDGRDPVCAACAKLRRRQSMEKYYPTILALIQSTKTGSTHVTKLNSWTAKRVAPVIDKSSDWAGSILHEMCEDGLLSRKRSSGRDGFSYFIADKNVQAVEKYLSSMSKDVISSPASISPESDTLVNLDATDKRILSALPTRTEAVHHVEHSRYVSVGVAPKIERDLGLTENVVYGRLNKLIGAGFVGVVDANKPPAYNPTHGARVQKLYYRTSKADPYIEDTSASLDQGGIWRKDNRSQWPK